MIKIQQLNLLEVKYCLSVKVYKNLFMKIKLLIFYLLFLSPIFVYPENVFAEVFGHYYMNGTYVILYDAQTGFSDTEVLGEIRKKASYKNLHLVVYVWNCEEKIDRENSWMFTWLFTSQVRKELKQCQKQIDSTANSLYKIHRELFSDHNNIISALVRLNNTKNHYNQLISTSEDDLAYMRRVQDNIEELEQSVPVWRDLKKKTRTALMELKKALSDNQISTLDDLILKIESLKSTNKEVAPFFEMLSSSLEDMKLRMSEVESQRILQLSPFVKNYRIISTQEQGDQIRTLGLLVEEYMQAKEFHDVVNLWIQESSLWLKQDMQEEKTFNPFRVLSNNPQSNIKNPQELFIRTTQEVLDLQGVVNNTLDSNVLSFSHFFISGTGFSGNEEESYEISEVRELIRSDNIPVYISEWFKSDYKSHSFQSLVVFIDYEKNIQKYLQSLEEYIKSRDKYKSVDAFMKNIRSITQAHPSLQEFVSQAESQLTPVISVNLEKENELLGYIREVSMYFSDLKNTVENNYYGSPVYVLFEYLNSRSVEISGRHRDIEDRKIQVINNINTLDKQIAEVQKRLLRIWGFRETSWKWIPVLERIPKFRVSFNLYPQMKLRDKRKIVKIHKAVSSKRGVHHIPEYSVR